MSIMAGMDEPIWRSVNAPSADTPLQFGIRDLLIAQAVCAVCLGLFMMVGIFALMTIFIATLVYCAMRVQPERRKLKRWIVDLMGGVVLPAMCLVYDPGFFYDSPNRLTDAAFVAIVLQMLTLPAWAVGGRYVGRWSALFGGVLLVGAVIAGTIGAILSPLSVLGTFVYGIGLLGFTPFLTCVVFSRNLADAMRQAHAAGGKWDVRLLFAMGLLLAAGLPFLMESLFGQWIEMAIKSMPRPQELGMGRLLGIDC